MPARGIPNPDLVTADDHKAHWNVPEHRRRGFHNLHETARYALSFRAPSVLPLPRQIDWKIGDRPDIARFLRAREMSAFVAVREGHVVYEAYAPDFAAEHAHSIQSITKMTLNLMLGRLVADGALDLEATVASYLPEIGSGYATATLRDVADMNIANDFAEDYTDPHTGTYVMETAMGWRLPPEGHEESTIRAFSASITGSDLQNREGHALYKSTNSDVLGWVVERVSGRALRHWLMEIAEAAGIEGCFHITCDREGTPLVDGGACLRARDLARLGLLFARGGEGVDGRRVGDADFIESTRRDPGPPMPPPRSFVNYSRQTITNGKWLGHGGYGGQFMLADPDTDTAVVYFSVLENKDAHDPEFYAPLIEAMGDLAAS